MKLVHVRDMERYFDLYKLICRVGSVSCRKDFGFCYRYDEYVQLLCT